MLSDLIQNSRTSHLLKEAEAVGSKFQNSLDNYAIPCLKVKLKTVKGAGEIDEWQSILGFNPSTTPKLRIYEKKIVALLGLCFCNIIQ